MSLDEKHEEALYDAIKNVAREPRPSYRERVFKNALMDIAKIMNWKIEFDI